jgi:hypothetical protein
LNKNRWAQFRERVTCVSEDELAAFLRDQAALLRPDAMGEEEFAAFLHGSANFLRNGRSKEPVIPSKATDRTPIRGILAMSPDELNAFMRDRGIEFPALTPEDEAEKAWEAKLFEAIESGAIEREKPGRKATARPTYLEMARNCLNESGGNIARARETFIERAMKSRGIERKTAENRWSEAMKTLFPER